MYQGKFDNKRKKPDSNVRELLSQRSSEPEKKKAVAPAPVPTPDPVPAPVEESVPVKVPVKKKKAAPVTEVPEVADVPEVVETPEQKPVKKAEKKSRKKKNSKKGSAVFYTFYIMLVLVLAVGSFLGYRWLEGWLTEYEAAQVKCQEVFQELFADPDWGALYERAGVQDTLFEGKDAYIAHMQSKVGDADLTCLETSAGLSRNKKFEVRFGNEKIASFTMEGDRKYITDIPDWQLSQVELVMNRNNTIRIQTLEGTIAYVNGVALDDSYTVQIAGTAAEDFLPMGITGIRMYTQEVAGLMAKPVVTVMDETGANLVVEYDDVSDCYVALTDFNTITDEQRELALESVKTYCKWMIQEINSRGTVAKCIDPSSNLYRNIIAAQENPWLEEHNGFKFENESVSGFTMYGDNIFSVQVALSMKVTRTDGSVKEYAFNQALFFNKKDDGRWLCYNMTDADITLPRGEVRLTFMNGNEMLTTDFYDTNASEMIVPVLSAPEGKVFAGWMLKSVDENGRVTTTLVFQPDDQGRVHLAEDVTLVPMVLYAYYQDGKAVETAPAEPETQQTTVAETEPAETEAVETESVETESEEEDKVETEATATTEEPTDAENEGGNN